MVNNEIKCNGQIYKLDVALHNGKSIPQLLDCGGILSLIYSNEIGDIFVRGDVHYIDKDSLVAPFVNRQNTYISINLKQIKRTITANKDGEVIQTDEIVASYSNDFLVTNIDIISNELGAFEYRILFISKHIIDCNKYIQFSSYNETKSITDIIKTIFKDKCKIQCNNETFENNRSDVRIKYITGQYDTIVSSMSYLLNRQFFYPAQYDKNIRIIIYDDTSDVMTLYKVGGTQNKPVRRVQISIKYLPNKIDPTSIDAPVNVACVVDTPTYQVTQLFRDHKFWKYSFSTGLLGGGLIDAKTILNYYESEGKGMYTVDSTINSTPSQHTAWQNNITVYQDTVKALVGNNGLIANVYGTIGLIPGMETSVTMDIDNQIVGGGTDTNIVDSKVKTYKTITKGYVISKVVNIISFTGGSGIFRQNLHLMTASQF